MRKPARSGGIGGADMTEISTIIRARLSNGRSISDEDVLRLLAERDALKRRIAELEAALKDMAKHIWRGDWDKLQPETRAILEPKE